LSSGLNLTDSNVERKYQLYKTDSDNRPSLSYGTENIMYLFAWYGRQINTNSLRDYWMPGRKRCNITSTIIMWQSIFNVNENNSQTRIIYGNININYKINDYWGEEFSEI
jgi:hypothetical protein